MLLHDARQPGSATMSRSAWSVDGTSDVRSETGLIEQPRSIATVVRTIDETQSGSLVLLVQTPSMENRGGHSVFGPGRRRAGVRVAHAGVGKVVRRCSCGVRWLPGRIHVRWEAGRLQASNWRPATGQGKRCRHRGETFGSSVAGETTRFDSLLHGTSQPSHHGGRRAVWCIATLDCHGPQQSCKPLSCTADSDTIVLSRCRENCGSIAWGETRIGKKMVELIERVTAVGHQTQVAHEVHHSNLKTHAPARRFRILPSVHGVSRSHFEEFIR